MRYLRRSACAAVGVAGFLAVVALVSRVSGVAPDREAWRLHVLRRSGREPVQLREPDPPDDGFGAGRRSTDDGRRRTSRRGGQQPRGKVSALQVPVPPSLRIRHTTAWVYTPPGYDADSDTPYPALYLLHGSPGRAVDWIAAGLPALLDRMVAQERIRPLVVIAPDVRAGRAVESSSLDSTRGGPQVESYLTRVLVPWAHRQLALRDDPAHRGIGGMSSGAFGALNQGLRHPETFGTIIAVSPYGHPGRGGRRQLSTPEQVAVHSPNAYVDTIALSPQTGVFLAYGAWEERFEAGRTARDLGRRLVARGVDVRTDRVPCQGHTWRMTMTAAPAALEFFEHWMAAAG